MNVLALNPGSSTLKFSVHRMVRAKSEAVLIKGLVERLGESDATLTEQAVASGRTSRPLPMATLSEAVEEAIQIASRYGDICAVGCRVVHGGSQFDEATVVTEEILDTIKGLEPLAPLHNARDVEAIEAAIKALPQARVVAVFDTAFHRSLPPRAYRYALPTEVGTEVRRYGFHGISYQYVHKRLRDILSASASRLVVCHLGSGASVCAIRGGFSVDTSMGMTPLEGLIMGTRSGDIDPGLVLYLMRVGGKSCAELEDLLNHQSGLLALSGKGSDVRDIELAAESGDASALFAIEAFCYRVAKYVASYTVALSGLDALAFTGGIGEGSPQIRTRICGHLKFLGIELDELRNEAFQGGDSALSISPIQVWVVSADEESQIAEQAAARLSAGQ